MAEIKIAGIVSCSSEGSDSVDKADNLLQKPGASCGWKIKSPGDKAAIIFQLEKPSKIGSICLGNRGSAFVEVLVGHSRQDASDFKVLLPVCMLSNLQESRNETNATKVRTFAKAESFCPETADLEVDRVKVVCTQPFNKKITYGLSFISFISVSDTSVVPKVEENVATKMLSESIKSSSKPSSSKLSSSKPSKPKKDPAPKQAKLTDLMKKTPKRKLEDESESDTRGSPVKKTKVSGVLQGVVAALSGYKNPLRSELREALTKLGAVYRPDWESDCTHLICNFPNTPKFKQVEGEGVIVSGKWVQECDRRDMRVPYGKHLMTDLPNGVTDPVKTSMSEEAEADPYGQSTDESDAPTDVEMDTDDELKAAEGPQLPDLPDHLKGKCFFFYNLNDGGSGDAGAGLCYKDANRLVVAYGGDVKKYMEDGVDLVITNADWDKNFDDAVKVNANVKFLRSDWLLEVHNNQSLVSTSKYVIGKV